MSGIRQQTVKSINFVWNGVCLGFVFTRYAQGLTFLSEQYVIVRLHIHFFPPFVHPAVAYTYIQNIHPLFFKFLKVQQLENQRRMEAGVPVFCGYICSRND